MNCSNCGADVAEGASFCPSCGASTDPAHGPDHDDAVIVSSPEDAMARGKLQLASIGRRFGARIIDGIIAGGIWLVVAGSLVDLDTLAASLIGLLIFVAYEVGFVANRGQTPGKMALGIKIVDVDDRVNHPSPRQSFIRYLVPAVPGIIPIIGGLVSLLVYLSATWDSVRQGWHDKAAGTVVIKL